MWLRLSVAHDGAGAWASLSDWQQAGTSLLHVIAFPSTWQRPGFKSLTLWGQSKPPKGASYAPLAHHISTALRPQAHWNTITLWQTPSRGLRFRVFCEAVQLVLPSSYPSQSSMGHTVYLQAQTTRSDRVSASHARGGLSYSSLILAGQETTLLIY